MKIIILIGFMVALAGCGQQNVKQLLDNVNKDCVIHGTFAAATGVPGNVSVAGTIDCKPSGAVVAPATAPATGP